MTHSNTNVRPIRSILVANRAEIARRIIRTARAMGIRTVAVFSDVDDGAAHMLEADEAVRLPGSVPGDTYLRADLVIAAARATGADAVHPGYGFLSENAAFATAVAEAGLTFIGPSPHAIDTMGSKVRAKSLMQDAGVPVLPGFTVGASTSDDELLSAAETITYPVLVKASFGGGGRGMRVVGNAGELTTAVAAAQREAGAAFGDDTVFLERYVENPRHIEVQIFGDVQGTVVSLFERECSIQRRHQKVIEEAPSPAVDADLREALCAAACAAGRSLGYVGAGTVEFVMAPDGSFFFLEVNTRLQVEHPVTEAITGLDLVRLQIEVAQGMPLPAEVIDASMRGHAIEARLYAEDVPQGFLPVSGTIDRLRVPLRDGVRFDGGYTDGSAVSTFYDAMLGKVVAWASTRAEAATVLADTLARAEIHGIVTNRDLLVNTLRHPDFVSGHTDTGFFDRHDIAVLGVAAIGDAVHQFHALGAALAPSPHLESPHPAGVPRGWRNVGARITTSEFVHDGEHITVAVDHARAGVRAAINGDSFVDVHVVSATAAMVEFELLGIRRKMTLHRAGHRLYVDSAEGSSTLLVVDRFPAPEAHVAAGSLMSPMPGSVVAVHAAVGDSVVKGQTLVALEAMKMEHAIRAPLDGVVTEVLVSVGEQVDTGAVLVVVGESSGEQGD